MAELPPPPEWLPNGHALREWQRLGGVLIANRLLTAAGLGPLAHLCALHGALLQRWTNGTAPTPALIGQWRVLANDFALTPATAGRVSTRPNTGATTNPFTRHGRRPADE